MHRKTKSYKHDVRCLAKCSLLYFFFSNYVSVGKDRSGLMQKVKMGTSNCYVNIKLMELLSNVNVPENAQTGT